MFSLQIADFSLMLPEIILTIGSLLLLVIGAFRGNNFAITQNNLSRFLILLALISCFFDGYHDIGNVYAFSGLFKVNFFTVVVKALLMLASIWCLTLAKGYYESNSHSRIFEFPVLILLSLIGMMVMISANNFLILYLGLELQSLALYVLASINRDDQKSSEAGLKYFILGSLSSGLLLFGISFVYGFSGTIDFKLLSLSILDGSVMSLGMIIGLVLILVGFCFKISAAPFHMWTPDVYQGAPTPVTAFFAVVPKMAGISIMILVLMGPFFDARDKWQQVIIFTSCLSMLVGSFGALKQNNIKRLLAYSSIGHVGYVLMGLAAGTFDGIRGILIYMFIYIIMSIGVFACVMIMKLDGKFTEEIDSLSGLSKDRPYIAAMLAILLFSMAGIPPLAGFFGKFYIFMAVLEANLYSLAILGVLASVVSAYYYLRIIKLMYFDKQLIIFDKDTAFAIRVTIFASGFITLLLFLALSPLVKISEVAANVVF